MHRYKEWGRRKKGVAGIIAAVFLFAMIFTTGLSFFLIIQYNYQLQHMAAIERAQMEQEQSLEQFELSATLDDNNFMHVVVNNTGPINIQIVYLFVNSTIKTLDLTSSPIMVNSGSISSINSTQRYEGGKYIFKVVTGRGNIGVGTYPLPPSPITEEWLAETQFGPTRLYFFSFRYYEYKSEFVLNNYPDGNSGFNATTKPIAFRVKISNFDPDKRTLTLSKYSHMWIFFSGVGKTQVWYIVNVKDDGTIESTYSPISIPYGETKFLVFASKSAGSFKGLGDHVSAPTSGTGYATLLLHGLIGTDPYSQNIPFVGIFFE